MSTLLFLLAAPAIMAVEPISEEEVLVIGQRLERVQVNVARDRHGRLHCSLNGSSGNTRLDERLCKASANCVRKVGHRGEAVVRHCIVEGKSSLMAQFRKEWRRSGSQ